MTHRAPRLAGLASALTVLALSTAATAQIKIGFMATMSGPAATLGQDQFDGFMLGVEHSGGRLGGQQISVIKEEDRKSTRLNSSHRT